ncbi:Hypothetical predicted protein [Olea europaea subsp. europaea]|uniref:Uncharacterized protein n=1 Tax=Olea europaea subsp. europaea TaxID=158383 RepID=A0A8S0Q7V9_OLEEU|nr:Hypothetical predicted protein [Olea europaea subsp. europaea]
MSFSEPAAEPPDPESPDKDTSDFSEFEHLTIIENDRRHTDWQVSSSPKSRVTISDEPTIRHYDPSPGLEDDEPPDKDASVVPNTSTGTQEQAPDPPEKSPYVMEIDIDNSVADPRYDPSDSSTHETSSLPSTSRVDNQGDTTVSSRGIEARTQPHVDSPMPQRKTYNLRSNPKRTIPGKLITCARTRNEQFRSSSLFLEQTQRRSHKTSRILMNLLIYYPERQTTLP